MSKAERPPITYIYDREKRCFFFISNLGTKHKVTQAAIIANGIQDLCIGKDMDIHKISEMKPEDIHYVPKGDILCLKIEPPFNGNITIIQDIADDPENMKRFVRALFKFGYVEKKGKDYDVHGGDDYFSV